FRSGAVLRTTYSGCHKPGASMYTPPAAGARVDQRFIIESKAASGGMGTIFRACDGHTGKVVALKLLQPTRREEADRFTREAMMLSELRHGHIVSYVA